MAKNSTVRTLRISLLSTGLALLMLCVFALSASAQAVPANHAISPATSVKVNIVKNQSGYNFSKHKVTITQGEKATLCNKTTISQSITYQGFTIYTIPANTCQTQTVSFSPGSYKVHLKSNSKASLTIVVQ
ncbi:MAG: hypothetical protein ABI406_19530 [Ktedonobacteraceae bacterium]